MNTTLAVWLIGFGVAFFLIVRLTYKKAHRYQESITSSDEDLSADNRTPKERAASALGFYINLAGVCMLVVTAVLSKSGLISSQLSGGIVLGVALVMFGKNFFISKDS